MVYVGALAALLDIDFAVLEELIAERFKGKDKLIEANIRALRLGFEDAQIRFACPLGIRVERSEAVGDRILVEGNYAAALGALYGGATVCAWYPITPSTSVAEAFERLAGRYRVDAATGQKNVAIVQAEDEIAAIGMVVGAGWNGARAFTATSGPGMSLMQEFFGLAYFAEIPAGRRSTCSVAAPRPACRPARSSPTSCLRLRLARRHQARAAVPGRTRTRRSNSRALAFDLAERLQTPVFVMLDLDIGMNSHLCEPFTWDDARKFDRGKVMSADELEAGREFGRYLDVDGDGIP